MDKIFKILLFIMVSICSYAKVNDSLSLFDKKGIQKMEDIIKEIKKEEGVKVYVNTLPADEGFIVDADEKVIIINLKKIENNKIETEVKFSKDIINEDNNEVAENILDISGEKKPAEYVNELLVNIKEELKGVNIEEQLENQHEIEKTNSTLFKIVMVIVFIGAIIGIIKFFMKRDHKGLNEEMNVMFGDDKE